ncbi:MAG TPA: hypothetical protein VI197_12325 [Polyangiaceae bacterium]
MKKNAREKKSSKEGSQPEQRALRLAAIIRYELLVMQEGLKTFDQMLEQDRKRGPVKAKGSAGDPVRWGRTDARLSMDGRRVVVSRPRVRQNGKEVELPTWEAFADDDSLDYSVSRTSALVARRGSARRCGGRLRQSAQSFVGHAELFPARTSGATLEAVAARASVATGA